jgi:hypothetical protein
MTTSEATMGTATVKDVTMNCLQDAHIVKRRLAGEMQSPQMMMMILTAVIASRSYSILARIATGMYQEMTPTITTTGTAIVGAAGRSYIHIVRIAVAKSQVAAQDM